MPSSNQDVKSNNVGIYCISSKYLQEIESHQNNNLQ